ncbi:MAG: ABC transporter permease, partial [Lachnospiraceae bacterium]|nr:ABC transporter permease [Lachnospiraceae bacterium]
MSYYFHLAFKYIKHNKARTAYSILGIALTFVLCFCILTMGFSAWDYSFYADYQANPYELVYIAHGDDNKEITYTPQMINALKRLTEDEAAEEVRISSRDVRLVLPQQLKAGESYDFKIKLKNTDDLQKSADMLGKKYGFELRVISTAAVYFGQGEAESDALVKFLIELAAAFIGGFSVMILRNTMMIAVTERGKDFGLLRCVGMSDAQHRMLLFTEGIVMSILASALGMGFGFWLLKLIEPWFIKSLGLASFFSFRFYPKAAVYTAVLCIAVTLFSMFEPARLCAQVSPLEALHGVLAKELTVGRAVMLLAGKLTGGDKKKRKSRKSLAERIFGAPGFYADKNLLRGKGKGVAVFIAMLFSMFLLLSLSSFTDTYTETISSLIRDMHTEYTEYLYMAVNDEPSVVYDSEKHEKLREALMKRDKVKDCFWVSMCACDLKRGSMYSCDDRLMKYAADGELDTVYELGCVAEDMEKEKPYLLEGEIDYERMLKEDGVLLCDISPSDENGKRKTDYKAGDFIETVSTEGALKAKDAFSNAVAAVSEKHGIDAWLENNNQVVYFEEGEKKSRKVNAGEDNIVLSQLIKQGVEDTEFYPLQEEVLTELADSGYDCREYLTENSLRMFAVLEALKRLMFERGMREQHKIFGILKSEVCTGRRMELIRDERDMYSYIRLVMPMELLMERIEKAVENKGSDGSGINGDLDMMTLRSLDIPSSLNLAIARDMEILDENIRGFGESHG